MSLTLEEYWEQQAAAMRRRSVHPEAQLDRSKAFLLIDERNPYSGYIDARVWFDDEAFLDVWELVHIDPDGLPHRERYSYHLQVDGREIARNDFAPDIEDPGLQHHINRTVKGEALHIPSERITLVKMVEQCWGLVDDARGDLATE